LLVAEGQCRVCKSLSPGQPLGIFEEPLLDEQTLTLAGGQSLLLYTDGINDERDPGGEVFGLPRLLGLLGAAEQPSAQALVDHLLESVLAHLDGAPQDDDITLLAVRAV
jgi:sigma-B regulation protein RsbU (phosphoserine phosphatase)